ncbi:MAG: cell division protein FtsL [Actinomycetota bacterium]
MSNLAVANRRAASVPRGSRPSRPSLRVVRAPSREQRRTYFALWCLAFLVFGMIALLALNTALTQGSFQLHELQETAGELSDREQTLRQDVNRRSAPEELARAARGMGMVPSDTPAFVDLTRGQTIGNAQPGRSPSQASQPSPRTETRGTELPQTEQR